MRSKFKIQNSKFKIAVQKLKFFRTFKFLLVLLTFTFLLFTFPQPQTLNPNVLAAGSNCQPYDRASGLISVGQTGGISGKFGNPTYGTCVVDPKAAFISYKIPTYNDLKSIYFTQAKDNPLSFVNKNPVISGDATEAGIPMGGAEDQLFNITGNLNLSGNPSGTRTGVVFIDGNLNINTNSLSDLTYGSDTSPAYGLVFIVGGDVNIAQSVRIVNAVIVSSGTICTAYDFTPPTPFCPASAVPNLLDLTINGGLVSLDSTKSIKFMRSLGESGVKKDSSDPAENVNYKPKYLVILKEIFSSSLNKWTEVAGVPYIAPTNAPTSTPTPTPTTSPGIQFDASSTTPGINGSTLSWNHVTGSGTNRIMVVGLSYEASPLWPVTNITYNGKNFNGNIGGTFNGSDRKVDLWYLLNPDTGNHVITVTLGGADATVVAGATTWTGVDQSAPTGYLGILGNTDPYSINIPSAPGQVVVDDVQVHCGGGLVPTTAQQTSRWSTAGPNTWGGGSSQPGASTVTMSWTGCGFQNFTIGAVPLKPAGACPPTTWYRDADGDGYGNPSVTQSSCTQPAGYVANNTDCYDGNILAHPGQTNYYTTNRGDGSFDYDCNGTWDQDPGMACLTSLPAPICSSPNNYPNGTAGYVSSIPACGQYGTWRICCSFTNSSCTTLDSCSNGSCGNSSCPLTAPYFKTQDRSNYSGLGSYPMRCH